MTPCSMGTQPKDWCCWAASHQVLLSESIPRILTEVSHLAIRTDECLRIHFTRLRSAL